MSFKDIYILGIESSCDDTSASVLKNGEVLSNVIANQNIHKKYGGVVPELASRAHLSNIIPVVDSALKESNVSINKISAIAFTRGPGLMGSLIILFDHPYEILKNSWKGDIFFICSAFFSNASKQISHFKGSN